MASALAYSELSRRDFLTQAAGCGALAAGWLALAGGASSNAAEPRFRVVKTDNRWLFSTPGGHPYWLCGVFNVDLSSSRFEIEAGREPLSFAQLSLAKYGSEAVWARQAVRRLRGWGFNCLAEYASEYALPIPMYGRSGNPEFMPFMAMIRPAAFSLRNRWGYAPGPVKDLIAGTDPGVYTGWRGATTPDVFDPNFAIYAHGEADDLAHHLGHSRFLLGVTTDDADDLFGFGPGPEVPAARTHPHIGWLALVGASEQRANPAQAAVYADTRVHTKLALQAWLRERYGTVDALNRAWRSGYTSFGSDGGWPLGHGLMDESGRSPWVGTDAAHLRGANAAMRSDLDGFLLQYARSYFRSVADAVRRSFPGHLVFGPATLNSWNGLTRAPILQAAGENVDVLQANAATDAVLARTLAAAGDLPLVTWTGMAANADSDLHAFPNGSSESTSYATQVERGAAYARTVLGEFERTCAGSHPVAGTKFWGFADSWAEKMNWGLVSLRDNAYDGQEAVRAAGQDAWGFATGKEERDYGDCITSIRAANARLLQKLLQELTAGSRI